MEHLMSSNLPLQLELQPTHCKYFDEFSVKSTRNQHFNIFFAIFSLMIDDTFVH